MKRWALLFGLPLVEVLVVGTTSAWFFAGDQTPAVWELQAGTDPLVVEGVPSAAKLGLSSRDRTMRPSNPLTGATDHVSSTVIVICHVPSGSWAVSKANPRCSRTS